MSEALDRVFEEVANLFSIECRQEVRITEITPAVLRAWSESWKPFNSRKPPDGGWDWVSKAKDFKKKPKYRIEIAIWANKNELCGLALGKISKGEENISIYYIEGSPNLYHSLKGHIFDIVEVVCLDYARLLKKTKSIRLMEPVKSLRGFYKKRGYVFSKKLLFGREYCEKEVKT